MTKARTVTLFIPTLAAGGAERATLNLAEAMTAKKLDVTLLVQRPEGELVKEIPENIKVESLNCSRSLFAFIPLILFLRRNRPDFFIANMGHGNIISLWARALSTTTIKIIVCQHSMLSAECQAHAGWQYKILPWLYRRFLPWADAVVAVSSAVAADLNRVTQISSNHITTIHNAVVGPDFMQRSEQPCPHPWFAENTPPVILGIGRLSEEKDFPTLIQAFALACKSKDLRLVIIGQGPQLNKLKGLASSLSIGEYVDCPGFTANPLPYIKRAAILAVSSKYEGMSNVLVEALACGTNVISTNCPGGPAEILECGHYGALVPVSDPNAMAQTILATLQNPKDKNILQQRGQDFSFDCTVNAYIKLFDRIQNVV
jgi:glycosyltransferase involved in cell wall biosynthesis